MSRFLGRIVSEFRRFKSARFVGDDDDGEDTQRILAVLSLRPWTWRLFYCTFAALIGTSFMTGFIVQAFVKFSVAVPSSSFDDDNNKPPRPRYERTGAEILPAIFIVTKLLAFMGPAAVLADKFGRKKSLMFGAAVGFPACLLGILSAVVNNRIGVLLLRSVACGMLALQSGNGLVVAPAYLVEMAPDSARGSCGVLYEIFFWVGVAISFIIDADFFGYDKLLLTLLAAIYALHFALLFFVEESPSWLLQKKLKEKAVGVLMRLRHCDYDEASCQIDRMNAIPDPSTSTPSVVPTPDSLVNFLSYSRETWGGVKRFAWPVFLGSSLLATNLLTGTPIVHQLQTAMAVARDPAKASWNYQFMLAIVLFLLFFCLMSICALLVDRIGRRRLILLGLIVMTMACMPVSLGVIFKNSTAWQVGTVVFMAAYSIGPGPIAVFIVTEMFDQHSRLYAMSFCHLVTQMFLLVWVDIYKASPDYGWVLMPMGIVFCLLELFLLYLFLPETKQVPLEEAAAKFQPGQRRLQFRFHFCNNISNNNNQDQQVVVTATDRTILAIDA